MFNLYKKSICILFSSYIISQGALWSAEEKEDPDLAYARQVQEQYNQEHLEALLSPNHQNAGYPKAQYAPSAPGEDQWIVQPGSNSMVSNLTSTRQYYPEQAHQHQDTYNEGLPSSNLSQNDDSQLRKLKQEILMLQHEVKGLKIENKKLTEKKVRTVLKGHISSVYSLV